MTPVKIVLKPVKQPYRGFVQYDPARAVQLKRQAMKESFGKRAGSATVKLVPKFDKALGIRIVDPRMVLTTPKEVWAKGGLKVRPAPQIRFPVEKSVADVAAWTTKTGRIVGLKAKTAPIRAVLTGEDLTHAVPKVAPGRHAKPTRTALVTARAKRAGGYIMREAGYRPDYLAMLAARTLPGVEHVARAA